MTICERIYSIIAVIGGIAVAIFWGSMLAEEFTHFMDAEEVVILIAFGCMLVVPPLAGSFLSGYNLMTNRMHEWLTGLQAPAFIVTCAGAPIGLTAYLFYRRIRKRRLDGERQAGADEESYHRPREEP